MGPTNVALVKLFRADQQLREAQGRLDSASRSVRVLERRVSELKEQQKLAQVQLREQQARAAELELEVKSRDEKIERLRTQQQNAKNHKEYQAFLTEINTEKIDKEKVEEDALKVMEAVERMQGELSVLSGQLEAEQKQYEQTRLQLGSKLSQLQAEVESLRPNREEAAKAVSSKAIDMFDRLAERFEGE